MVINSGDTAWMLASTGLVLLMTPGLAFFYGGMVRTKSVLNMMMMSMISMGVVSVLWVIYGFELAFGYKADSPWYGSFSFSGLGGVVDDFTNNGGLYPIPVLVFAAFQLMFAIITPGLVVGAVAERIRFTAYSLFIVLFGIIVYAPLAHMAWHPNGLMFQWGVLDFAGGSVVHISAGMAALAGALVLKPRKSTNLNSPANIPYVLIGTGLLWFGWFGFNAGSATSAGSLAAYAFATTNTSAAAAGLAWMFFDVLRGKKPSVLGFCIGAVVGLVAITPAAGFVGVPQAIFIGFVAAIVSNSVAEFLKHKTKLLFEEDRS